MPVSTHRALALPPRLAPHLAVPALGLLVLVACLLGIFARPIGFLSAFWPANGLLLGLLVRYPGLARPAAWVAAAAAYMAADLATGSNWLLALWLNAANLLGVAAGWLVLRRLDEPTRQLRRTMAALHLLLAALAASAAGALAACGAAPAYFHTPWTDLLALWFSTELMNYVLILPVVLSAPRASDPPPATQGAGLFWRVAPVGSLLAAEASRMVVGGPGMLALAVPALLWCALSYSTFTTSVLSMLVCLWTMAAVAMGVLNFTPEHASEVLSLRIGVTLLALGPLAVACASAARAEALQRLAQATHRDALTGVLARRAFLRQGERLLERHQRGSSGVAVMALEVAPWPAQADAAPERGALDPLLASTARTLALGMRTQDLLGRVGSSEFAVVLPEMSPAGAQAVAERLRCAVEQQAAPSADLRATVSIGLVHSASLGGEADMGSLLLAADAALYRAKAQGGNRLALG